MKEYLYVLKNYTNFSGRSRRKEYWTYVLVYSLILLFAAVLDNIFGLTFEILETDSGYGWIYFSTALLHFLPSLAVLIRRLHDVGKSGWFYFIILIPIIGFIWVLVLLTKKGDVGLNLYGPDPKFK